MLRILPILFALACNLAVTLAAPAKRLGRFSIQQTENPSFTAAHGPSIVLGLLSKYGDPATMSEFANSTGTVKAIPYRNDKQYVSLITIDDTDSKPFSVCIDTGSADFWLIGPKLLHSQQAKHHIYRPDESKLLRNHSWQVTYGDGGGARGEVYIEPSVSVGSATVTNQAVQVASELSMGFANDPIDGVLGLGFNAGGTVEPSKQNNFFQNAIQQGLAEKLFTVSLKHDAPGSFDFGHIDSKKHEGQIHYTDVVQTERGYWAVSASDYFVGDAKGGANKPNLTGVVDTGSSLLHMSLETVTEYYKQVPGALWEFREHGYTFPCNTTLPDFTLNFDGEYNATIPGKLINYCPASKAGWCFGGLQNVVGLPMAVYGDIFLKSQFTVFDKSQNTSRIGFAPQSHQG